MSRSGAMLVEREPLVAASVIAAQATLAEEGFRQRDVRFFLDLCSNWLQATTGVPTLGIHNVQVKRAIDLYVSVGWAKRGRSKPPRYRLTPDGLVELLRRLVERRNLTRMDEFLLVFHVLDAYGAQLRALVTQERAMARRSLALDVRALLDTRKLVARERAEVKRQLERLAARIDDARRSSELAGRLLASGTPLAETIAEVERRFPYDLNRQRTLTEALAGLPASWQRAELQEVSERRALGLWTPTRELLLAYDRVLSSLPIAP